MKDWVKKGLSFLLVWVCSGVFLIANQEGLTGACIFSAIVAVAGYAGLNL